MNWALLFLVASVFVVLIRLTIKRLLPKVTWYEFESWVHHLLLMKKDGGTVTLSHCGSPLTLRFRRDAGTKRGCDVLVEVPRAPWSEAKLDALRETLERHEIAAVPQPDDADVLLCVRLNVPDIWDRASGAAAARVGQHLFEALGLDRNARFTGTREGQGSAKVWRDVAVRWAEGENRFLRKRGRNLLEYIDEETQSQRSTNGGDPD